MHHLSERIWLVKGASKAESATDRDGKAFSPSCRAETGSIRFILTRGDLSNWIRAAKDGQFALPADEMPAFVPVVSVESARANKAAHERRSATIEIVIGAIKVRVPGGAEARDVEAVLRAVRRSSA